MIGYLQEGPPNVGTFDGRVEIALGRQINGTKPSASLISSEAPNSSSCPLVTLHQHSFRVWDWLGPDVDTFWVFDSLLACLSLLVSWIQDGNWKWLNSDFWVISTWPLQYITELSPIHKWNPNLITFAHFCISFVTGLSVHSSLNNAHEVIWDVQRCWFLTWAGRHSFSRCRCGSHTQNGLSSCSPGSISSLVCCLK